jgi:hypothetical protein
MLPLSLVLLLARLLQLLLWLRLLLLCRLLLYWLLLVPTVRFLGWRLLQRLSRCSSRLLRLCWAGLLVCIVVLLLLRWLLVSSPKLLLQHICWLQNLLLRLHWVWLLPCVLSALLLLLH